MRKIILPLLICMLSTITAYAQITPTAPQKVGVQTRRPSETLDVNGTLRIRELPKNGTTNSIYNGATTKSTTFTTESAIVTNENGVLGKAGLPPNWIYLPPLHLPADYATYSATARFPNNFISYNSSTGEYTVKLGSWAKNQLAHSPIPETNITTKSIAVKNPSATSSDLGFTDFKTRTSPNNTNFPIYITYYDTNVYTDVSINNNNELKYKVKPNAVITSNTYMNIIAVPFPNK